MHHHRDSKQGRCRMNIEMKDIYKWRMLFASMKDGVKCWEQPKKQNQYFLFKRMP